MNCRIEIILMYLPQLKLKYVFHTASKSETLFAEYCHITHSLVSKLVKFQSVSDVDAAVMNFANDSITEN